MGLDFIMKRSRGRNRRSGGNNQNNFNNPNRHFESVGPDVKTVVKPSRCLKSGQPGMRATLRPVVIASFRKLSVRRTLSAHRCQQEARERQQQQRAAATAMTATRTAATIPAMTAMTIQNVRPARTKTKNPKPASSAAMRRRRRTITAMMPCASSMRTSPLMKPARSSDGDDSDDKQKGPAAAIRAGRPTRVRKVKPQTIPVRLTGS